MLIKLDLTKFAGFIDAQTEKVERARKNFAQLYLISSREPENKLRSDEVGKKYSFPQWRTIVMYNEESEEKEMEINPAG